MACSCQKNWFVIKKIAKFWVFWSFSSHWWSFTFGRVTITLYLFHFLLRVVGLGGAGWVDPPYSPTLGKYARFSSSVVLKWICPFSFSCWQEWTFSWKHRCQRHSREFLKHWARQAHAGALESLVLHFQFCPDASATYCNKQPCPKQPKTTTKTTLKSEHGAICILRFWTSG